jgi:hypothetical protein
MKWGTLYSSNYVNVLFQACRRHITGDFRFVCLSDDQEGINPEVEVYPIPEIGLDDWHYYNGAWPKLILFKTDLYNLQGRCLFIDLDTFIWGNLDRFFDLPGGLIGIDTGENWYPGTINSNHSRLLGTGIFAFTLGDQPQILDLFLTDKNQIARKYKLEQVWVQATAKDIVYWPVDWVISFKRWLRRPIGLDFFFQPHEPPKQTSVVAFHGVPRPIDIIRLDAGFWDRFPHLGHGNVRWATQYWIENGGKVD